MSYRSEIRQALVTKLSKVLTEHLLNQKVQTPTDGEATVTEISESKYSSDGHEFAKPVLIVKLSFPPDGEDAKSTSELLIQVDMLDG